MAFKAPSSGGGIPAPDLYWKFDDGSGTTAADSSGNGYTGTLEPNYTWGTGNIVFSDGDCKIDPFMSLASSGVSVTGWTTGYQQFWALWDIGWFNAADYGLSFFSQTNFAFNSKVAGSGSFTDTGVSASGYTARTHIAFTFDNSGNWILYINGSSMGSGNVSSGMFNAPTSSKCHCNFASGFGGGQAVTWDHFRVYNKVLSSAEVTAIFNSGI